MLKFYKVFGACLIIIASGSVEAQKPGWADGYWRTQEYPVATFFTGFVSRTYAASQDPNNLLENVITASRLKLSESIQSTVKTRSLYGAGALSESSVKVLHEIYVTRSALETVGLTTETYIDEGLRRIMVFTYVNKRKLQSGYYKLYSSLMKEIQADLDVVHEVTDLDSRYAGYVQALGKVNRAKGMRDMMIALGIRNEVALMAAEWQAVNFDIDKGISTIRSDKNLTVDQSIFFLVSDLKNELKEQYRNFYINPVTFENSGIATEFSGYFKSHLVSGLQDGFEVSEDPMERYRLTGSYWVSNGRARITVNLHEYDGTERVYLVYGGSLTLSEDQLKSLNLSYLIEEEVDIDKHFEIVNSGQTDGGIRTVVTTQRGSESLIFKEGETLQLFVNVSVPSYLRLINVWSDGTQLSLLENYFIPENETNQDIALPFEWQAACPCGVEYIKLIAQSTPFESINLVTKDGLDYLEDDIIEIMDETRRVQLSLQEDSEFLFGESGFSLTTME